MRNNDKLSKSMCKFVADDQFYLKGWKMFS